MVQSKFRQVVEKLDFVPNSSCAMARCRHGNTATRRRGNSDGKPAPRKTRWVEHQQQINAYADLLATSPTWSVGRSPSTDWR
jgi:hypothetical protein